MSIGPNPVVRAGRYLQGPGHATNRTRRGIGVAVRRPPGVDGAVPDRHAALLAPADGRHRAGVVRAAARPASRWQAERRRPHRAAWHALLVEYLPFMTMLLALYTAGGGVLVRGGSAGTPRGNTALLALGIVAWGR